MSNEEKILSMLTKLQADISSMKTDIETIRLNGNSRPKKKLSVEERFAKFDEMANLLTDEDKDALGRYQAAEEARKAALYG